MRTTRLLSLKLPDDPEAAFRVRLAADRTELVRLLRGPRNARTLAALEDLAHGLAGSAGVFDFAQLGEAAARLERMAERYRLLRPATLSPRRKTLLMGSAAALLAELTAALRPTRPAAGTGTSITSL